MLPFATAPSPRIPLSDKLGDGCFLSILARSEVLEDDAEEESGSFTRVSSCDLGVDCPEDDVDLESIFSSVSVTSGVGVTLWEEELGTEGS